MDSTKETNKEDFSPLGIFISACLCLLLLSQLSGLKTIVFHPSSSNYHDSSMWVGLTSMYSIVLWLPGFIIGYKITIKLGKKVIGGTTIGLSAIQVFIFLWALAN